MESPHVVADNVCYLGMYRDPLQTWSSTTLRRQIQTFSQARDYEEGVHQSVTDFFAMVFEPNLEILYEDLF